MSLFIIVQMYSINTNIDEFQRFDRGFGNRRSFGNRRALVTRLKHHYPKETLFGYENQDNLPDDKHLFPNSYETIESNDVIQQQEPPIIYL
jgi:hypothetical protein